MKDDADLMEEHQERMCDLCERHILGCSAMSSTFLCEGSRCDDAVEYLKEDLAEEHYEKFIYLVIG